MTPCPSAYRPGLCSVTFRTWSPRDIVAFAVSAGIHAIEWGADVHVPVGDFTQAAAVRRICEEAKVQPVSYGTYFRAGADTANGIGTIAGTGAGNRIGNSDAHLQSITETARVLGAPNIRVWGGPRGLASRNATAEVWARAAAELRRLAELASPLAMTLSLEFHADSLVDTAPSAVRLIDSVAHPALFTKWQPTPGITPAESLEQIDRLQPWLSHIDVFARDEQLTRFALRDFAELWTIVFQLAKPSPNWPSTPYALLEFVQDDSADSCRADVEFLARVVDRS